MVLRLIALFFFFPAGVLLAQSDSLSTENNWREVFLESPEYTLPLLMEAAIKNSEDLNKLEMASQIAVEEMSLSRKSLLNGFSFGTSYSYGTMLSLTGQDQPSNSLNAFTLPAQPQYNSGIYLSYPLSKILGYSNEIRKQKLVQKQAMANEKIGEKEVRKAVILQYQDIVLAKAQLELYQQSLQAATIHLELAESQFTNGEIPVSEMSKINESYGAAAIAFRTAKIKYEVTILLMEELIGMKIVDLMNNHQ